jgi:hypothetical protein
MSQLKIAKLKRSILNDFKRIERTDLLILDNLASLRFTGTWDTDGYYRRPESKTIYDHYFATPGKKMVRRNR